MKPVRFLGHSLQCLRDFPEDAWHDAGYQLAKVQRGEAVYVLHAFQKKTQATPKRDIDTARKRFAQLSGAPK